MNIRSGINWTKIVVVSTILCTVFSFSAMAQNNPNKPLNENEVRISVFRLKEKLRVIVEYSLSGDQRVEVTIEEVFELWDARRNLVGKTRAQVIDLFHSD